MHSMNGECKPTAFATSPCTALINKHPHNTKAEIHDE